VNNYPARVDELSLRDVADFTGDSFAVGARSQDAASDRIA